MTAGSGTCYIKFVAVRPSPTAALAFERLLDTCEAFAAAAGARTLVAGMSLGRVEACRALLERGFHADLQGVALHRGNAPGYHRPGVYAIDDWR